MSTRTATEPRPVRVTLEGAAYKLAHDDTTLVLVREDGVKVCLPEAGPGITVEYVEPARTWTDGDVVQNNRNTYDRWAGSWRCTGTGQLYADSVIDTSLAANLGGMRVLRYQAGEE